MSEVLPVSAGASVPYEAAASLLKKALDIQKESMTELLAAMGIGQNVDVQA